MIHKTRGTYTTILIIWILIYIDSGIIKLRLHKDSGLIMLLIKPTKKCLQLDDHEILRDYQAYF